MPPNTYSTKSFSLVGPKLSDFNFKTVLSDVEKLVPFIQLLTVVPRLAESWQIGLQCETKLMIYSVVSVLKREDTQ